MADEFICPLAEKTDDDGTLFRPDPRARPGTTLVSAAGSLTVVGLGPGTRRMAHARGVRRLARAPPISSATAPISTARRCAHQRRHASDNRVEVERAAMALDLAAQGTARGRRIRRRSRRFRDGGGGLRGARWRRRRLAGAFDDHGRARHHRDARRSRATRGRRSAAISAPCRCPTISSPGRRSCSGSRPRLNADFVISLYNPISSARPWQLGEALKLAGTIRPAETPVIFARAVGRPE